MSAANDNTTPAQRFRLGLIVNPLAGLGGPAGLKGSDGEAAALALQRGVKPRAGERCLRTLQALQRLRERIEVCGYDGAMGGNVAREAGFNFRGVGAAANTPSSAADTIACARRLVEQGVDLLLFAGGDGTARDIVEAVGEQLPVLGLPAGVKMHSGVYAVSPEGAAEIIAALVEGRLVEIGESEVRDIDENAFREGRVRTRHFGELRVPQLGGFLQHTKVSGRESEELVLADIAAEFIETLDPEALYFIGPGSTTAALMDAMSLPNTLLGIDAIRGGEVLGSDLDADALLALLEAHERDHSAPAYIVVTAIGGQGYIFGRGNQQFSPALIRRVGRGHIIVVATKTKITELGGRPLLVDTNEAALDRELEGYIRVITGYRDAILYRVSASGV